MSIVMRAVAVGCVIFLGAVVGNLLQWALPAEHLTNAKGAIGMIQGVVTLLLALVLGLLVWTSYGVYAQQQSEAYTLGSQILQLDLALERYGPEASKGRDLLRRELVETRARFWGENGRRPAGAMGYAESRAELRSLHLHFGSLKPATDEQRSTLASAQNLSESIIETHYLMSRQLRNPLPVALINSVVLWAALVFCCVGMASTISPLSIVIEALGAASIASAIFLILEFSQPYFGLFRISPEGIDQVIAALSTDARAA
jgi:hypothetical protein